MLQFDECDALDYFSEKGYFYLAHCTKLDKIKSVLQNCVEMLKFAFMVTLVKILDFPAKKLRKNTGAYNTHAPTFFFKISSCNICINVFNFGVLDTHAPIFFKKKNVIYIYLT